MVRGRLQEGLRRHRDARRGEPGGVPQDPEHAPRPGRGASRPSSAPAWRSWAASSSASTATRLASSSARSTSSRRAGVVTAMVGLLTALPGTRLYQRLKSEGRILEDSTGNNTDSSLNFVPKLIARCSSRAIARWSSTSTRPRHYYRRILTFLHEYKPPRSALAAPPPPLSHFGLLQVDVDPGRGNRGRAHFWKLLAISLVRRPQLFPLSISLACSGWHFRKVAEKVAASVGTEPSRAAEPSYKLARGQMRVA